MTSLFSKGFSKLLVCGGQSPTTDNCEVIDLASAETTCKDLPKLPVTVHAAIGGLGMDKNPIICGGIQNNATSNICYTLQNKEWISSDSMNSKRSFAASAQLQDGKLLVTGGDSGSGNLNSSEILTEEGWESKVPSLPDMIAWHCMVFLNSTSVMAIAGLGMETFYFTFGEESWTKGPELKHERLYHTCGRIRRDKDSKEMSIIFAGGSVGSPLSLVDILDDGSNEWRAGPELPEGIAFSQMVEDQNGGVVLVGGASQKDLPLDTLYQLPHGGQYATWTKMKKKLKTGRGAHTAFLVPDNIVDCS